VGKEDTDIKNTLLKTLNRREQVLGSLVLYIDKQMQEITGLVQQRISEPAIKANYILKEENTLFGSIFIYNVFILLIRNSLVLMKSFIQS
jgi:hypothetical protein